MGEIESIKEGWKNLIWPNKGIRELAMLRASLCNNCKHNKLGFCIKCNCILAAKTRSVIEKCPISLW